MHCANQLGVAQTYWTVLIGFSVVTCLWLFIHLHSLDINYSPVILNSSVLSEKIKYDNYNDYSKDWAFLIQYYNNKYAVSKLASNLFPCLRSFRMSKVVVNIDDNTMASRIAWFEVLDTYPIVNTTLVFSPNLHEVRAYNMMAKMVETQGEVSKMLFLMQDDDIPPKDCDWIQWATTMFRIFPNLGVIGMNNAEIYGNLTSRTKSSKLCVRRNISLEHTVPRLTREDPLFIKHIPFQFAATVDIGPLVVRSTAFSSLNGFDEGLSAQGQPGIGLDFDLCWRMWGKGHQVAHMPVRFSRRVTPGAGHRNTQERKLRRTLHQVAQQRMNGKYNKSFRDSVARMVRRMNEDLEDKCSDH